jgi:hypothetical protein
MVTVLYVLIRLESLLAFWSFEILNKIKVFALQCVLCSVIVLRIFLFLQGGPVCLQVHVYVCVPMPHLIL